MTRQDYEAFARVIGEGREYFRSNGHHAAFASELARMLVDDNPRFDRERFIMAAMPGAWVGTRHAGAWERVARWTR